MISIPRLSASLIAALVLIPASLVHSESPGDPYWDPHFGLPGPVARDSDNRRVNVIELVGDEIYLGGAFSGITHVIAPGIAHWDGSQWESLGTGIDGEVSAILVEGNDVYVALHYAGALPVAGIARWDGDSWSALGDGIELDNFSGATSLVRHNGELYAAGWVLIDHAGGTAPFLVKWDGSNWSTSYFPGGYLGSVTCMKSDGTSLYVGGRFASFTLPPLDDAILRWDGTSFTTMGSGLQSWVQDLEFFNGQLHAVGSIDNSGPTTIRDIAAWNGASWYEVGGGIGASANASLAAAASSNGLLYVAGDFDQVGGSVNTKDLAWWDGSNWHAYPGPAFGASGSLRAVSVRDNNVFVAGYFTNVGGTISYGLGRWDGTTWFNLSDTPQHGTDTLIRSMATDDDGGLYAGGEFAYAGNTVAVHIGYFDDTQWHALGSGLTGASSDVWALDYEDGNLWAGGRFTNAGGVTVRNLARWDGTSWYDVGGGLSGLVMSVYSDGTSLYAGGQFTEAGATPAARIAKWDGTTWQALGSGMNGDVLEIIRWNGLLYAGGNFTTAGGVGAGHVASWDGANWAQVGAGLNSGVNALGVYNGELYATGSFSNSGGQPMIGIAKWDGSTWSAVGGSLGSQANDLEVTDDGVYVCGPFMSAGGAPAAHIARWTGSEWQTLGTGAGQGMGINVGFLYALAAEGDHLYVGGEFDRAGDEASACIARWNAAGASTGIDEHRVAHAGLDNCVPNPFNPSTTIRYRIAHAGRVTITIYDVAGRRVRTLVDRDHKTIAETLQVTWDGTDNRGRTVASGVYFCRMENLGFSDTRKMVLLK